MESYTQSPLFVTSKRCVNCDIEKPLSEFIARTGASDGHRGECRACTKIRQAKWYQANIERLKIKSALYSAEHRDEARERATKWYRENHARATAYRHAHCRLPGMREQIRRRTNSWRERNPDRHKAICIKRHARKRGAKVCDFTAKQWREQVEYFNGYCAYCNQPMPKPTADHMIPLCQHGDHTLSNIVPCCLRCNVRKQGRNLAQLLLAGGIK